MPMNLLDHAQKRENAGQLVDPALWRVCQFRNEHRGGKSGERLEVISMRPIRALAPAREAFQARTRRAVVDATGRLGQRAMVRYGIIAAAISIQ